MPARDPRMDGPSGLGRFLRAELAPHPGRLNLTLRCVVASAFVIVASMMQEVPFLAVSLIVVFYVTQANVVLTEEVGILAIVGVTLGAVIVILLLKATWEWPLLRILGSSALFLVCVYLMRVTPLGLPMFIMGLMFIYAQSLVDVFSSAEALVRIVLWVWVAIAYPLAVSLVINSLLLPAEPARQLQAELCRQLQLVRRILAARGAGPQPEVGPAPEQAALGLHKLLRFAVQRELRYRDAEAAHLARIAAVSQLYAEAYRLRAEGSIAAGSPALYEVRAGCARLEAAIAEDGPFTLDRPPAPVEVREDEPHLAAMRHTLRALADHDASPPPARAPTRPPLLAPDATSNPVYMQFALKTLLAVLVAYVFYTGAHWQGAHTVMLTSFIVAQPSLGATTLRAVLRVVGAAIGSVLALALIVFAVPHLDDIVGLLAISLPVIALGAWGAAGSERTNYAGTQLMFTFAMGMLEQGFTPTSELTPVRDRLLGIVLGVVLSLAIHALIAPETEGELVRQRLAGLLRQLGELLRSSLEGSREVLTTAERYLRAREGLADCEAAVARVELEPSWQNLSGETEQITLFTQEALGQTREILLAIQAFQDELIAVGSEVPAAGREAVVKIRDEAAAALDQYATALASAPSEARPPAAVSLDALVRATRAGAEDAATAPALVALVTRARQLVAQVCTLPRWSGSDDLAPAASTPAPA
jgi:multidrug resistance protein MdtO